MARVAASDPAAAEMLAARAGPALVELEPAFEWIWRAWWRLHRDRPYRSLGMAGAFPCGILWADIARWAAHHRYGDDALAMLDTGIGAMDQVFLEIETKRWQREHSNRNPPNRSR